MQISEVNNSIKITLKNKDFDPRQNKHFKEVKEVPYMQLESVLKSSNYSLIQWKGNVRESKNFTCATGFIVDIDEGLKIDEAVEVLHRNKLNYALITSKSHSERQHKFHIIIPFNRTLYTLENYQNAARRIKEELFPNLDSKTMDGARFIFGSKEDAVYYSDFSQSAFNVDTRERVSGAWDNNTQIKLENGRILSPSELYPDLNKQIIYCPFHEDKNPSAFLSYSKDSCNYFISCSSCGRTYWKIQENDVVALKCEKFWSLGTSVFQSEIVNEVFSMENISEKKFYVNVGAKNKEEKNRYYEYLVKQKHLHRISLINSIGSISSDKSGYEVDGDNGIITVKLRAIPIKEKDNEFVERYLEATFGDYKQFIKMFLAVYVYSNYRKLPTLILTGERGVGKNTFAETVQSIFPSLSEIVKDLENNFTPFAEKKLLIIDESASNGKVQYQLLKKFSGQKYLEVNKKYISQYQVQNNLNIILLSNDELPIYVERDEIPTDERNNQFFVYRLQPHKGFDANLQQKLIDRIGYYIRTELKPIFSELNMDNYRYSIPVPITKEEKKLFSNSVTDIEDEADRIIQVFEEKRTDPMWNYYRFVLAGYIPTEFFDNINGLFYRGAKRKVIQNLQKRKYLAGENATKRMINSNRLYCYKLGEKWLNKVPGHTFANTTKRTLNINKNHNSDLPF